MQASAQMHPDRFPDPIEQAQAVEQMSLLTMAYRLLSDPESRARELLRLSGVETDRDRDKLPPDLLMQVMDVREEMESALPLDVPIVVDAGTGANWSEAH